MGSSVCTSCEVWMLPSGGWRWLLTSPMISSPWLLPLLLLNGSCGVAKGATGVHDSETVVVFLYSTTVAQHEGRLLASRGGSADLDSKGFDKVALISQVAPTDSGASRKVTKIREAQKIQRAIVSSPSQTSRAFYAPEPASHGLCPVTTQMVVSQVHWSPRLRSLPSLRTLT